MPGPRVEAGVEQIDAMLGRSYCKFKELESLVGTLGFASRTLPRSGTFMRRMYDLLQSRTARGRKPRFLRLTTPRGRAMKQDLQWWRRLWREFDGVSAVLDEEWSSAERLFLHTDASWSPKPGEENDGGFGAIFEVSPGKFEFFGGAWKEFGVETCGMHISELEMLAVSMAMETWGHHLTGKRVVIRCDNSATVDCINRGRVRDGGMMVGMRELALSAAKHSFDVRCDWIATKENVFADSASRADKDGWGVFFRHCKEKLGLEPEQLEQVEPSLDVPAVLEKIRRTHVATARREAVGDVECARRPPR